MQHLSYKFLAAIIACSATMLLSGLSVHAAAKNNQQPRMTNNSNLDQVPSRASKRLLRGNMTHDLMGRHYTYQNLKAINDNQITLARLGSRRGRRPVKNVKKRGSRSNRRDNNRRSSNRKRVHKTSRRRIRNQNRSEKIHARKSRIRRTRRSNRSQKNKHKRNQGKRTKKPAFPKLVHPRERVINQKKSAVNHFKKNVNYVKFNQPANFISSENYGDSDYGRVGTPITGNPANGGQITFHRLTFIPKKLDNNQFYSPQGLVVNGNYAYVITNATNSYEESHNNDTDNNRQAPASYINGDDSTGTSPYGVGASQIIRIDLRRHVKDYNNNIRAARRNIRVGPVFYGGHGQGLAFNPKSKQLWLLNNKAGQVTKTAVSLINLRTLAPRLRINFHFGDTTIGDDLAFDKQGKVFNVTEAGSDSFVSDGGVKVFVGNLSPKEIHMNLVKQVLQWGPSDVIQGLTFNPRNNRIYILGDDAVMSVPVKGLGHLKPSDVWFTPFKSTREFEGLSFDRSGNAYLLVSRSPEILKAKYNQNLQF